MTRRPPQTAFEFIERGWRPSFMWFLILTVVLPFGLLLAIIMGAYAYAVVKAVTTGQPVPYLLGGIEHLPWQYIAAGLGAVFTGYLARGRQIVRETEAGGGQGRPPFAESPPPSSGPTSPPPAPATPPAGPPIDDLDGPRPGGNWQ